MKTGGKAGFHGLRRIQLFLHLLFIFCYSFSAIFTDVYYLQSLKMAGASVVNMLKSPFVDLKKIAKYFN